MSGRPGRDRGGQWPGGGELQAVLSSVGQWEVEWVSKIA